MSTHDDSFINSWLKFLLFNQHELIHNKLEKDISIIIERVSQVSKEKLPNIYFEFFKRNLKLLYIRSRESIIKIISYLNYYRCLQKSLNLSYLELVFGESIDGMPLDLVSELKSQPYNPLDPLAQQMDRIKSNTAYDKFFLTNPSLAHYGNLSRFIYSTQ